MVMVRDVAQYFAQGCGRCARFGTADCATQRWAPELARLRALCLDLDLEEQAKWGHPCYSAAGKNVAILGAFRSDVRITFFDAAGLTAPAGLLERAGPMSQTASVVRFTTGSALQDRLPAVRDLLQQARARAVQAAAAPSRPRGATSSKPVRVMPELPETLRQALAEDTSLAAAFDRLTAGRQRGYLLHISAAQKPETQRARIDRARENILAGKGWNERVEKP